MSTKRQRPGTKGLRIVHRGARVTPRARCKQLQSDGLATNAGCLTEQQQRVDAATWMPSRQTDPLLSLPRLSCLFFQSPHAAVLRSRRCPHWKMYWGTYQTRSKVRHGSSVPKCSTEDNKCTEANNCSSVAKRGGPAGSEPTISTEASIAQPSSRSFWTLAAEVRRCLGLVTQLSSSVLDFMQKRARRTLRDAHWGQIPPNYVR